MNNQQFPTNMYEYRPFFLCDNPTLNLGNRQQYFLDFFWNDSLEKEYQGYTTVYRMDKKYVRSDQHSERNNQHSRRSAATYTMEKNMVGFYSAAPSEVIEKIPSFRFMKKDYYISLNRMNAPHKRSLRNLFGINAMVVDIDTHGFWWGIHGGEKTFRECTIYWINEAAWNIYDGLIEGLPMPNALVFTGRGLQLWYKINPVGKGMKKAYKHYAEELVGIVKEWLAHNTRLARQNLFSVDAGASENVAGLVRLPGTYNTAANAYGDFFMIHDDPIDLVEEAKKHPQATKRTRSARLSTPTYSDLACSANKNIRGGRTPLVMAQNRENSLKKLVKLRHDAPCEYRNNTLLIVYSAYMSATGDEEIAMEHIQSFNNLFRDPMPEKEYTKYMSSAKKQKYKFTNKTIIDWLNISKEEQDLIDLHPVVCKERRNEEQIRQKKQERNEKILRLCREGKNITQITAEVDCSKSTVFRVLKKNHAKTNKQKTHESIIRMAKKGKSVNEILKKMRGKMSRSGVAYLVKRVQESGMAEKTQERRKTAKRENTNTKPEPAGLLRAVSQAQPPARRCVMPALC